MKAELLIDSNSYFRLAQSLHPLLGSHFGEEKYCIYIIKECDKEYSRNSNLQNKFVWVNQEEYIQNRKNKVQIKKQDDNGIYNNIRFIKQFARDNYLNVSEVDIKYLATALELELTLITDDSDMIEVAIEFEIDVLKTLELLKLMLECSHIDIVKIKEITDYWVFNKDLPKDFKDDCKRLFNL